MNIANVDMKKEFAYYNSVAPVQSMMIYDKEFKYRYYKHESSDKTIVMLAGGSGMADGFFPLARDFMEHYSFITFNYPMCFKGNDQLVDAIAQLIRELKVKNVYFWGQSYGGLLAQMIAVKHRDVVTGLILTSTASLSNNISFEGMQCFVNMLNEKKEQKRYKMYKFIPVSLIPSIMNFAFKQYLKDQPNTYKSVKELMNQLKPSISKEYSCHMTSLLSDLRNKFGDHHKEDFTYLDHKVLIIEPNDDKTFTNDIKEALIEIMTNPTVIRNIEGGHLAMMFNTDDYMKIIIEFLSKQ